MKIRMLTNNIVLLAIEKEQKEQLKNRGKNKKTFVKGSLVCVTDVIIELLINPKSKKMSKFCNILDILEKDNKIVSIGNSVGSPKYIFDKEWLDRLKTKKREVKNK